MLPKVGHVWADSDLVQDLLDVAAAHICDVLQEHAPDFDPPPSVGHASIPVAMMSHANRAFGCHPTSPCANIFGVFGRDMDLRDLVRRVRLIDTEPVVPTACWIKIVDTLSGECLEWASFQKTGRLREWAERATDALALLDVTANKICNAVPEFVPAVYPPLFHNGTAPPGPIAAPAPPRKRGRPKTENDKSRDIKLYRRWSEAHKATGVTKTAFAKQVPDRDYAGENLAVEEILRMIERGRDHEKRKRSRRRPPF